MPFSWTIFFLNPNWIPLQKCFGVDVIKNDMLFHWNHFLFRWIDKGRNWIMLHVAKIRLWNVILISLLNISLINFIFAILNKCNILFNEIQNHICYLCGCKKYIFIVLEVNTYHISFLMAQNVLTRLSSYSLLE